MATVTQVEDKNGNLFDIEDEAAQTKIGDLSNLETEAKTDLVSALNETLTPSQIETITTPLGAANFIKMGRLVKMEARIILPQNWQSPINILKNIDDKYLPISDTRIIVFDNPKDTPCGQAVLSTNSKSLNFWFSRDYQAIVGNDYVCDTLYISKT